MKIHEQSTDVWHDTPPATPAISATPVTGGLPEAQTPVPDGPPEDGKRRRGRVSRGKVIAGVAGGGVVAAAVGGYAIRERISQQSQQEEEKKKWPGWKASNPNLQLPSRAPLSVESQVGHLLRRAGFGATEAEFKEYAALGYTGAVDRLLNYDQVPDDEVDGLLNSLGMDLNKPENQQRWWMMRMAWTKRPLLEKMTLFWHGYLTTSYRDVGGDKVYRRMIVQNQFLRNYAFSPFEEILTGITADPAMLKYLDLTLSRRTRPNENYARELMELFTLGIGHYTQEDVSEAAVALTGWRVDGDSLESRYSERDHNPREKTFLGQTGNFNYKDIINILVNHQATPWFLCRKLFTFFVYENPSNEDLRPLVEAYVTSNHSLKAVMRALFLSPQFFSDRSYRTRMKSPVEFVVGAYRALSINATGQDFPQLIAAMGQQLFDPPNVAGWPGDKNSSVWMNTGTWMARLNFIDRLLNGSTGRNAMPALDIQGMVDANQLDTPERFVDFYVHFLLDGKIEPERRTQFIEYFTGQDTASRAQIVLTNGQSYPLNRVRGALYLILSSPEYQLN